MTDKRSPSGDLAAEHALGVLSGDELATALELERNDEAFAMEVARWRGRLAPIMDETSDVSPPSSVWTHIAEAIGGSATADASNVVLLKRRIGRWRAAAIAMTALAASLAVVVVNQAQQPAPVQAPPTQRPAGTPLVAMLGDTTHGTTAVVASWDPAAQRLVLAVPGTLSADPSHSHELWVIPKGGKPSSLGTLPDQKQTHVQLAQALATLLEQGATIAISVEPRGGSPTGAPTGPVVAAGTLTTA